VLVEGPSGIGKTTLLAAGQPTAESGLRVLSARGLALEAEFSFGIVRQLFEPVRAAMTGEEWDSLLDGAAELARRVFDGGTAGERDPYATTHGLYWLAAGLAARGPLLITVDDLHWADAPSLRWLSHLAARLEDLPVGLVLAARSGLDQPELIDMLRAFPYCARLSPQPLSAAASAVLVRQALGGPAADDICTACYESTGGNPFLLDSLLADLAGPGDSVTAVTEVDVKAAAPQPVAEATLRRVGQLGNGGKALTQSVAVFGGPAPLRQAAALAEQDMFRAALLADRLRAAGVLSPGTELEFAHAIVGTAIYESIPAGERALRHARAAWMLADDGADAERVALHLLRGEPAGDQRAVGVLRAAADAANGRGAPDTAIDYLRRALAEPPDATARPAVLLELGLALASVRDTAAVAVLEDAVAQAAPDAMARAALLSAGALGAWGHHGSAREICRGALARLDDLGALGPAAKDGLEAALFAESWFSADAAGQAWAAARQHGAEGPAWRLFSALSATIGGEPRAVALERLGPAFDPSQGPVVPDNTTLAGALVLIWNDEFPTALRVCEEVLADARKRGSLNLVADLCCLRSVVLRRLGRLRDAVTDARLGLDCELPGSPPLTVAWAASHLIEPLVWLGRIKEADEVAGLATARRPPDGWIQSTALAQARGVLRVTQYRYEEALDDLARSADGWRALGITAPAAVRWRIPAITAHLALGREDEAARLAAEQLALARRVGAKMTLGNALRAAAPFTDSPEDLLREAVRVLGEARASYDQAEALADLGAYLHRAGRRADAQQPLRRALDLAERAGAQPLSTRARRELRAVGARPRRTALTGPDALTSAERQVAALAADGLTNKQIAQHLFITQATVETHLRHAFHKLGVAARGELPTDLRGG
jgi:DNA-binding CsgD family transcriptional regulator